MSNVFFEMGNIGGYSDSEELFTNAIKKDDFGFYLSLNNKDGHNIKKYPYYNEDHMALTEWVEVESIPYLTEYKKNNFDRIFSGSIRTQVVAFLKDKNSENSKKVIDGLRKASIHNREED